MKVSVADITADARWFPFRYNNRTDQYSFAWIPREVHQALTFLVEARPDRSCTLSRSALKKAAPRQTPMHLILHTGLGGSTLLARALYQPGVVTSLREPPILTDMVAYALKAPPLAAQELLAETTRWLARPFGVGDAVVCKMSSIGNGLVGEIANRRSDSQILCLRTPLERFLSSLVAHGQEGRLGGRKLFIGIRNSRMAAVQLSDDELVHHSDLQLAGLAWLSIQKMIAQAAARFGVGRVRSISSEDLADGPAEVLTAIAGHFRLDLDVRARLASDVFKRDAKTGERFNPAERKRNRLDTLRRHNSEIQPIIEWIRKTAAIQKIPQDLPYPLIGEGT